MKMQHTSVLQLQQKLKQREKELQILFDIAQTVSSLDLQEVLDKIVKIATRLTRGDSCLVYLFDHTKDELVLRASKNPHKDVYGRIKMKLGEGLTGWVAQERKPVVISEKANRDKRFKLFRSLPEDRYEAFLSVPILNSHGVVGVINIQHKEKHIQSEDEIELLSAIGKLVGGVVENARLVEESLTLREILETRKLVDRAKGILMKRLHVDEEVAYRKMQKQSMNLRKSIREIAQAILVTAELEQKNGS